ncbi:MAG: hypothetical protein IKL65_01530 [Bacilli bacterium]|nr:hypothetical protein [Bacilli bacterium]
MKDGRLVYYDDKVMVTDYKKRITIEEREYQDNIKEIITTENIIEELENEKDKLNNKKIENSQYINSLEKNKKLLYSFLIIIPIFSILLGVLAGTLDPNLAMGPGLKAWQFMGIAGTIMSTVTIAPIISTFKHGIKRMKKENNGCDLELIELEKELESNKEFLAKLNADKTKKNQELALQRVHESIYNIHKEKYNEIKKLLTLFYQIGANESELIRYYNEGTLEENLKNEYDVEEIEKIKTYLKLKNK